MPERVGGFDEIIDWSNVLSLGEQQRLIFSRLLIHKPGFVILDEVSSAMDEDNERQAYQALINSDVGFISVGHRSSLIPFHDCFLQLSNDTSWQYFTQQQYQQYRDNCHEQ